MTASSSLPTDVRISSLLLDIEGELRGLRLWAAETPSEEALASTQPFCIDTLSFPEWLQFVFLPTMRRLIEEEQTLPERCGIAPMAEEHFRGAKLAINPLLDALEAIDEVLSGGEVDYTFHRD